MNDQIEVFRVPSVEYALNKHLGVNFVTKPALRISVNALHTKIQIQDYLIKLEKVCSEILRSLQKKGMNKLDFLHISWIFFIL